MLADKRILVSGGGSGLGREMPQGFAAHGATVCICGRRESVLDEAVADITDQTGATVIPVCCNLRDPGSVEVMVERI